MDSKFNSKNPFNELRTTGGKWFKLFLNLYLLMLSVRSPIFILLRRTFRFERKVYLPERVLAINKKDVSNYRF